MKRRTVVLLVTCLAAIPLSAFDGNEHRELSNQALTAALAKTGNDGAAARELFNAKRSFGDVTVAVDWFTTPDNLLEPERLPAELDERKRNWLLRGLAVYNNATHFQRQALDAWSAHHADAIRHAKEGRPKRALLAEAVALHYLQDFFAAGHVVTPRRGMHDAVAGSMHDQYNAQGVAFALRRADEDVLAGMAQFLCDQGLITKEECDAFLAADGSLRFHGDGSLAREEQRAQKVFVLIVSTLSLVEVLGQNDSGALQACFSPRRVPAGDNGPKWANIVGPEGGIRLVKNPEQRVAKRCQRDGEWLGQYTVDNKKDGLAERAYGVSGITVRGDTAFNRNGDWRANVNALLLVMAEDPPGGIVDDRDDRNLSSWANLSMGAGGITYTQGQRYNAWGLFYDYTFATRFRGTSVGVQVAPRRYHYGETAPWRLDVGAKGTVGVSVLNFVFGIERGHNVDPSGKFVPEYFGTIGVEGTFAGTWVQRYAGPFGKWITPGSAVRARSATRSAARSK